MDISPKRCKRAKSRSVAVEIESIPIPRRKLLGMQEPLIYKELEVFNPDLWVKKYSEIHQKYLWEHTTTGETRWSIPNSESNYCNNHPETLEEENGVDTL